MNDGRICKNHEYGRHIYLKCKECGSEHFSKNIGSMSPEGHVSCDRTIFDLKPENPCKCTTPHLTPLIHPCEDLSSKF